MGMYEDLQPQREEVAYFMRRLYQKNLTTCSGGNISVRGPDGIVLITPATIDKGELKADQVILVTMDGECLTPEYRPTIEAIVHLEVLRRRPDMNAVIHAHPAFATAFACLDATLDMTLSSEGFLFVEKVARAPFALPGTQELADAVADAMSSANAALMTNHGVITAGPTLLKAFDFIEVVEITAKMNVIVTMMGGGRGLSAEQQAACNVMIGRE